MAETVFWDTAAFVALGNADDNLHESAVALSRQLADEKARILTTDAVLTEVVNTFSRVAFRSMARQIISAFRESTLSGAAQSIQVDSLLWQRGWQLFLERPDKDWSLTDCISFLVMNDHQVRRAFTSDQHFEQAGYARLLRT
jgi:predicted nucleic acid-binding protein